MPNVFESLAQLSSDWAVREDVPADCKHALSNLLESVSTPAKPCPACEGRCKTLQAVTGSRKRRLVRCSTCNGTGIDIGPDLQAFAVSVS